MEELLTDKELVNYMNTLKKYILEHSYRENHEQMFTLASGKKSPYYFDLKMTIFYPPNLLMASKLMLNLIYQTLGKKPDYAGGLTMGADPLVYGISSLSAERGDLIYPLIVRKQSKDHGSKKRVEGIIENAANKEIILIDDVITTGGSTLQAYEALCEVGFKPKYAFSILDREEGGLMNLAASGVTLKSLFSLADFKST